MLRDKFKVCGHLYLVSLPRNVAILTPMPERPYDLPVTATIQPPTPKVSNLRPDPVWFLVLLLLTVLACGRGPQGPVQPQEVFGVLLGGTVQELKAVHSGMDIPLRQVGENIYSAAVTVATLGSFEVVKVTYTGSAGRLEQLDIQLAGDVEARLEKFIDRKYSYDVPQREELERRYRWVGNIGEKDHYWLLPGMAVIVLGGKDETRLVFRLKKGS